MESIEHNASNSKTAGRWTKEEHQRFVEALKLFGKNWKKVEEHVGTRSGAQIRSHAQKFFNRLQREVGGVEGPTTNTPMTPANPTSTTKEDDCDKRKWSVSSVSTNHSFAGQDMHFEEEKPYGKDVQQSRKFSEDYKPNTTATTSPNEIQKAFFLQMMKTFAASFGKTARERVAYGSLYEAIMEKFKKFKQDSMINLKLSDLVDMTSRTHDVNSTINTNTTFTHSGSSFKPSRRATVSFSCRVDMEEPALAKKLKVDEDITEPQTQTH
jgi:SHAQKYF class myb-like DNA-binding protein